MGKKSKPEFYWYTLDAADVENIHWMTDVEIYEYNMGGLSRVRRIRCPQ